MRNSSPDRAQPVHAQHPAASTVPARSRQALMTVGQLAERTGLSAKVLREYADTGLVYTVGRSSAGYRIFDETALSCVAWIGNLRSLGLTVAEIRQLACVYCQHSNGHVGPYLAQRLANARARIDERIVELEAMRQRIDHFADSHQAELAGHAHIDWWPEAPAICSQDRP